MMPRHAQPQAPRLLLACWIAGVGVLLGIAAIPINHGLLRLLVAIWVPALWLCATWLLRDKKPCAIGLFGLGLALAGFALLPGRTLPPGRLRSEYVAQLETYEGVRYLWGGENRFGIDCSGLVRRALIRANWKLAFATANPEGLRTGFDLWWHDCTARALRDQYRRFTVPLFPAPSINAVDPARLEPGDVAVTADGVHVLAYLGNRRWIEADPSIGKVLIVPVPAANPWFSVPVTLLRWAQMQET